MTLMINDDRHVAYNPGKPIITLPMFYGIIIYGKVTVLTWYVLKTILNVKT